MIDKKILDNLSDLSRDLRDAVPLRLRDVGDDLEKTFRDVLQAGFSKFDLVTREEFDVQTEVLLRTREKLAILAQRLDELEKKC